MIKTKLSDKISEKLNNNNNKRNTKNLLKKSGYGLGIKISLELFSSVLVGTFIGIGLDKIFLTKPIFFIIFLVLGIIAGFYSMYKSVKNLNN